MRVLNEPRNECTEQRELTRQDRQEPQKIIDDFTMLIGHTSLSPSPTHIE